MNHCSRNWSRASCAKTKKGENRNRVGGTKRERTNEAIQRFALLKRDNQDQTWTCRRFQMETDSRSFYGLVTFLSLVAQSFVCVSHPRITISQILRFRKRCYNVFSMFTRSEFQRFTWKKIPPNLIQTRFKPNPKRTITH